MSDPFLDTKFYSTDFDGEVTLRGYLIELLATLWDEGEGFSPKRPFGDSSWEKRLGRDLEKAGLLSDEDDVYDSVRDAIDKLAIDNSST